MNGAQKIIQTILAHGVHTVFGYPGGAIMPTYDALYGSPLRHILCRHEQGAAFAAGGYARSTGGVGVCLATSGPGATNLITGLADAHLDSVPVVAITGQVGSPLIGTDAFQEVDVLGLSLAVTKHSYLVRSCEELVPILYEAFQLAVSGRPGPVLVDVPRDIQLTEHEWPDAPQFRIEEPEFDESALTTAREALTHAQRPVLYFGGGVPLGQAVPELRALQQSLQIPAVATLKGLGVLADSNPLYLGMVGMHGNPAANRAVQEADLVLCIGARFDDRVTGKLDEFAAQAKVVQLDIDPAEISKRRTADIGIVCDLRLALSELHTELQIAPWRSHCHELKKLHAWTYFDLGDDIHAPALLKTLSERRPTDSVVSCDVGQHQMWVAQHVSFQSPRDHLSSGALGAMGFGLPSAIGACLARPQSTIINVAGDGSFMMNVQELATIKRYQLPIKIVVMDNQRLGMVKQWQQLFFEGRLSETILDDNPDFVALANVFNIPGHTITRPDEVDAAITRLFETSGPYLLHVRLNQTDNVWPLVPPGAPNHHMLEDER